MEKKSIWKLTLEDDCYVTTVSDENSTPNIHNLIDLFERLCLGAGFSKEVIEDGFEEKIRE